MFSKIENFRDLGNLKTKKGKQIERYKLYRSGNLDKATNSDIDKLINKYHIALIIDLRTKAEIDKSGNVVIPRIKQINIPLLSFDEINTPSDLDNVLDPNYMFVVDDVYKQVSNSDYSKEQTKKIMEVINNFDYSKGAILFHCKSGKDRTGVVAATIYKEHGYSNTEIEKDYVASNNAYFLKAIFASLYILIKTKNKEKAKQIFLFYHLKKSNIRYFL